MELGEISNGYIFLNTFFVSRAVQQKLCCQNGKNYKRDKKPEIVQENKPINTFWIAKRDASSDHHLASKI